eukprot:358124_1
MVIEIERAFRLHPNIENRLNYLGAKLFKQIKQHDIYFDTKNCVLTRNDYWLRTRNNVWQLKYQTNHSHKSNIKQKSLAVYNEIQGFKKVHDKISNTFSINKFELFPLADFITNRKAYKIAYNKREYSIDLDFTDFNYNMIEIETLIDNESEINKANRELDAFCNVVFEDMEIESMETPYTKIQMYLYHNNLVAHDLIVDAGRFPPQLNGKHKNSML